MDDIEIPSQIDVEIRLQLILAAVDLAMVNGLDHDTALSHAHLWHEWVDPSGVDRVRVVME